MPHVVEGSLRVDIAGLLKRVVDDGASDLHVKVGSPPRLRIDGKLVALTASESVRPGDTAAIAQEIIPVHRIAEFEDVGEIDFALSLSGVGRFRVTVYRQRGSIGMVLRRVIPGTPRLDGLNLPSVVSRLADEPRGLVLVCGPSGSGKTTTTAAILDHINESQAVNIVTIEDPIEILHQDKQAVVNQREVGTDTKDHASGLRRLTRLDPDVVMVSDLHDPESISAALAIADAHLVVSSLHTPTVTETLARLLEFFGPDQQRQIRWSLASSLRGVICQRLLERADGTGRVPAAEIMVKTGRVFERIVDPTRLDGLERVISEGRYYGMQTLDQSLLELYRDGVVDLATAMAAATHPHDFKLALKQAQLLGTTV